uniref:Uncharacterized protein n=1 Tax=Arundo donax TaxID=35708 RepID=A0A0A9EE99_ARUDO
MREACFSGKHLRNKLSQTGPESPSYMRERWDDLRIF